MAIRVILFFMTVLLLALYPQDKLLSQKPHLSDTIKTVAIFSSKKSFFKDYPVDSLVMHLNWLNINPQIIYYKSTEDRSKTGFYADYLIDLDVWIQRSSLAAPKWNAVERTTPKFVRSPDGTQHLTYITTKEERYEDSKSIAGDGGIRIKIIEKRENQNVVHKILQATNKTDQDLKLLLIIQLMEFVLAHFSH